MPKLELDFRSVKKLGPEQGCTQSLYIDRSPSEPSLFGVRVSAEGQSGAPVRTCLLRYRIRVASGG